MTLPRAVRAGLATTATALGEAAGRAQGLADRIPRWVHDAAAQFAWERTLSGPDMVDLQFGMGRTGDLPPRAPAPWDAPLLQLRRWRAGALPGVPRLFFEVDATRSGPRPLVFPGVSAPGAAGWALTAVVLLELLSEGGCPQAISQGVLGVVRALPPGGAGTHLGWMGARGTPHARWIGSVPRSDLAGFLVRAGWPGDAAAVSRTIDTFVEGSSHVQLGLDVLADGVGPRLGVEVFWAHPHGGDARMERALDLLADWAEVAPDRLADARRWSRGTDLAPALEPRLQLKLCWDGPHRAVKGYFGCWNL